MHEDSSRVQNG